MRSRNGQSNRRKPVSDPSALEARRDCMPGGSCTLSVDGIRPSGGGGTASLKKLTVLQRDSCCNVRPRRRTTPILDCHAGGLRKRPLV